MKTFRFLLLAAILIALVCPVARAQIVYSTSGSTYSQNFNSLGNGLTVGNDYTWTDNTTLPGWYAAFANTGGPSTYRIAGPNTGVNGLLAYQSQPSGSTATEAALGSRVGSSGGALNFGIALTNSTGFTLTSVTIGFTAAEWYLVKEGPVSLDLSYQIGASDLLSGSWTDMPEGSFAAPTTSGTGPVDSTTNSQTFSSLTIDGLNWEAGTDLWIKWTNTFHGSGSPLGNASFSVDNFSFSAVPEPQTASLALISAVGLGLVLFSRRRAVK